MKLRLLAALCLVICASCAPKAFPLDTPNPLDEPGGGGLPSVEQLHRENIRDITGNKAYGLAEELSADWAANNPPPDA